MISDQYVLNFFSGGNRAHSFKPEILVPEALETIISLLLFMNQPLHLALVVLLDSLQILLLI